MSKFTLSNNYIDEQKSEHPAKTKKSNRRAIVIGSDFTCNIGFHIANKFAENEIDVKSFNKNVMDMISNYLPINEDDDILVLANGYTYLDWIENLNDSQILQMINDTFLASVRATNQFVQKTIKTNHKKYIIFIAWELAPKGYNVITINPSNTEGTPMTEETIKGLMRYRDLTRQEAEKYWGATLPKHNWLQPEEIADICSFFISGKADYMSGTQIDLAGGQR